MTSTGHVQLDAKDRFDGETAFVGAVLHLSAAAALDVLSLLRPGDFADPRLAAVVDVCRDLARGGTAPDPVAVFAHARAHAIVSGADPTRAMALLLSELYDACPTPVSVYWYRNAVLDGALRRRVAELAARTAQAVEDGSLTTLTALLGDEVTAVGNVQARRAAARVGQPR